jgi:hypothetical protein
VNVVNSLILELPNMDSIAAADTRPPPDEDELGPGAKRRKLRKGTRSCWECKRKKAKCYFESITNTTCVGCARRRVPCITQDLPEDSVVALDVSVDEGERIVQLERLVYKLAQQVNATATTDSYPSAHENNRNNIPELPTVTASDEFEPTSGFFSHDNPLVSKYQVPSGSNFSSLLQEGDDLKNGSAKVPMPLSWTSEWPRDVLDQTICPISSKYAEISLALLAAFPSRNDIEIICSSSSQQRGSTRSSNSQAIDGIEDLGKLAEIPSPETHPVFLAKKMLTLAAYIHTTSSKQLTGLSENPQTIKMRLAKTAIDLVTTNEELHGSIECLECIIQEALFQCNSGNLRRSWMTVRRAIAVAQLMGLHRSGNTPIPTLDPNTKVNPHNTWFRIVYLDRFISLLLGMPLGSVDTRIDSDTALAGDTQSGRLQRTHAVVAARIIERSERDLLPQDFSTAQDIDAVLLKAARELPDKFWLPPDFFDLQPNIGEGFWKTMRLVDHMYHYTLLQILHLPYLLHHDHGAERNYEYSRMTCINASREILTRYVTFRGFQPSLFCCRPAHFFALTASMVLILAHIDSRRRQWTVNYLAHQRVGDRATVEQALTSMELFGKSDGDIMSGNSAVLLRRMLDLEAKAAQSEETLHSQDRQNHEKSQGDESDLLRIVIPYFGTIKITSEGAVSVEQAYKQISQRSDIGSPDISDGLSSVHVANHFLIYGLEQLENNDVLPAEHQRIGPTLDRHLAKTRKSPESQRSDLAFSHLNLQLPTEPIEDGLFTATQDLNPDLIAGMSDWAFQGVDNAFFDILMKGVSLPAENNWQGDLN